MMDVADAKRLKALERENAELKKMYADAPSPSWIEQVISSPN